MILTSCVLCKREVITSNCLDGICRICWKGINDGDDLSLKACVEHDVLLETFPKQKGRFVR